MSSGGKNDVPVHVAIIMDGNGRWAKMRNLDRTQGHAEGVKRVEDVISAAGRKGIKVLTFYTFSTENWNRPESEVSLLMNLLTAVINTRINNLKTSNVRFQFMGRRDRIPTAVLSTMERAAQETKENTGLIVNLAFNYGARLELIDAIKSIALEVKLGKLAIDDISEKTVSGHLYTHNLPDPDLLIRTSGEKRISNFLLWQLSYAEFYFTEVLWPDFNESEFNKAIDDYQNRERRFGNLVRK